MQRGRATAAQLQPTKLDNAVQQQRALGARSVLSPPLIAASFSHAKGAAEPQHLICVEEVCGIRSGLVTNSGVHSFFWVDFHFWTFLLLLRAQ